LTESESRGDFAYESVICRPRPTAAQNRSAATAAKTIERKIRHYTEYLAGRVYSDVYGISNLSIAFITTSKTKAQNFLDIVREVAGDHAGKFIVKHVPNSVRDGKPPSPTAHMVTEPWLTTTGMLSILDVLTHPNFARNGKPPVPTGHLVTEPWLTTDGTRSILNVLNTKGRRMIDEAKLGRLMELKQRREKIEAEMTALMGGEVTPKRKWTRRTAGAGQPSRNKKKAPRKAGFLLLDRLILRHEWWHENQRTVSPADRQRVEFHREAGFAILAGERNADRRLIVRSGTGLGANIKRNLAFFVLLRQAPLSSAGLPSACSSMPGSFRRPAALRAFGL
jgi:hypothetical protein